jgi:hypothetical protein
MSETEMLYPNFENDLLEAKGHLARLWLAAPTYSASQIEETIIKLAPRVADFKKREWFIHDRPDLALLEKLLVALGIQTDTYLEQLCSPDALARGNAIEAAIPMFTAIDGVNSYIQ